MMACMEAASLLDLMAISSACKADTRPCLARNSPILIFRYWMAPSNCYMLECGHG